MSKQTAVDFLWTKASSGEHLTPEDFEQAKAMEKEQIIEIVEKSRATGLTAEYLILKYKGGEQ